MLVSEVTGIECSIILILLEFIGIGEKVREFPRNDACVADTLKDWPDKQFCSRRSACLYRLCATRFLIPHIHPFAFKKATFAGSRRFTLRVALAYELFQ